MIEFFKTQMGHVFYEGTMPRLVRSIERLATAVEALVAVSQRALDEQRASDVLRNTSVTDQIDA